MTAEQGAASEERLSTKAANVPISEIVEGYTPRSLRIDHDHVRVLTEVIDQLPPVILHESTKRLLDGFHRLAAFRKSRRTEIPAVFFAGDENEAVALAIRANVTHGRPLSRSDRQGAVTELMTRFPTRSDRWIADTCGVSHTTVAKIRLSLSPSDDKVRLGRDGRVRRLPNAIRDESMNHTPPATVVNLASSAEHPDVRRGQESPLVGEPAVDMGANRFAQVRTWLERTAITEKDTDFLSSDLPHDQIETLVGICRNRSQTWAKLADHLTDQLHHTHSPVRIVDRVSRHAP